MMDDQITALLEFERRRRVKLRAQEIWIVSREDLIISKLEWGKESTSERQLEDVRNLLAAGCDMDYIEAWSKRLELTDMLTRALG